MLAASLSCTHLFFNVLVPKLTLLPDQRHGRRRRCEPQATWEWFERGQRANRMRPKSGPRVDRKRTVRSRVDQVQRDRPAPGQGANAQAPPSRESEWRRAQVAGRPGQPRESLSRGCDRVSPARAPGDAVSRGPLPSGPPHLQAFNLRISSASTHSAWFRLTPRSMLPIERVCTLRPCVLRPG